MNRMRKTTKFVIYGIVVAVLALAFFAFAQYTSIVRDPDTFFADSSEIRVTAKIVSIPSSFKNMDAYSGGKGVRLYYGGKVNGLWVDLPAEFFELHVIDELHKKAEGIERVFYSHVTQIGDTVVIALAGSSGDSCIVVEDTLGTKPLKPFEQYQPTHSNNDELEKSKYVAVARRKFFQTSDGGTAVGTPVPDFTYVILPIEAITEDYTLSYTTTWYLTDDPEKMKTYSLTGTEILEIIGN